MVYIAHPRHPLHRLAWLATTSLTLLTARESWAGPVPVADSAELIAAVNQAAPGDEIILAPGTYLLANKLSCAADGTADEPIVIRADALGGAVVQMDNLEGFHVQGAYWEIANLDIEGVCQNDSSCEHAFHVTGDAEHAWIHNNIVHGFNAHIKANGTETGPNGERVWPDDVVVEFNEFFNEAPRDTSNPVTPIDVVGGRRWIVRGNFIHDHAKAGGNTISYAAFLKGNSREGVFERNLVVCELLHTGQTRLGLSFGGGGSSPDNICEDGTCNPEHQGGIMRNNIIAHCPADVGIYVNEGQNTLIFNNTIYDTTGIDMRFDTTTGEVRNNILSGQIRNRDGASANFDFNLDQVPANDWQAWFTDPDGLDFSLVDGSQFVDLGEPLAEVIDDYCANVRDDGLHDIGALEYDGDALCDTSTIPPTGEGGDGDGDGDPGDGDGDPGDGDGDPGDGDGDPGDGDGDPGDGDGDPSGDGDGDGDGTGTGDAGADAGGGEAGCSCDVESSPASAGWTLLAGLGLLGLRRRRRADGCQS